MNKINLTGHKGFIGSHYFKFLESNGFDVEGYDKKNNFDLKNKTIVSKIRDCDILLHLAAFNGTKHFYTSPIEVIKDNTLPTINLIDKFLESKTKFVFASTCEIFNSTIDNNYYKIPTDENVPIMYNDIKNPRWSYSLPKALGENLVSNSGLDWLILRYFNIYGPGQIDHFISEFTERALKGEFYIVGNDTRSFCYIDDAITMTHELVLNAKNQIYNVGNYNEISIKTVAELILEILGIDPIKLEIQPSPTGSVTRRCPDLTKTLKKTNFEKFTDLKTGLTKTLKSFL